MNGSNRMDLANKSIGRAISWQELLEYEQIYKLMHLKYQMSHECDTR